MTVQRLSTRYWIASGSFFFPFISPSGLKSCYMLSCIKSYSWFCYTLGIYFKILQVLYFFIIVLYYGPLAFYLLLWSCPTYYKLHVFFERVHVVIPVSLLNCHKGFSKWCIVIVYMESKLIMNLMNAWMQIVLQNTSHVSAGVVTLQTEASTQTKSRYKQDLLWHGHCYMLSWGFFYPATTLILFTYFLTMYVIIFHNFWYAGRAEGCNQIIGYVIVYP